MASLRGSPVLPIARLSLLWPVIVAAACWIAIVRWHAHPLIEGSGALLLSVVALGSAMLLWPFSAGPAETMAPLVAIIGCDGAGKSTLAADMLRVFGADMRVATCYLGLGSGEMGERIKRWPLIGAWLEAKLARKAAQTRTIGEKIPGLPTALVIFGFSLLRRRRFRKALALRRRGVAIITDRYPQNEVAGFYDGPGLSAARAGGHAVAWLAARERRLYDEMVAYRPDLVLRLNVDAETALRRKPSHKPDSLRAKVAVTPTLRFNGARIVELDSCEPYAAVAQAARTTIGPLLVDRRVPWPSRGARRQAWCQPRA